MRSKPVKKAMLKDQLGMEGPRPFLFCRKCGGECSANAGDYFMVPDSHVFTCCKTPMQLATKREVYTLL